MIDMPISVWQQTVLFCALLCAFGVSVLLVTTKRHHGRLTMDSVIGVQKVHQEPTPRVGGIGIYLAVVLGWFLMRDKAARDIIGITLLAGIAPLALGLLEDVTKRVGVLPRLLATMAGGVIAWLLTGIALNRLDIHGLDWLMAVTPISVLFTAFAVGGVANAINIIDGFHGLASGTTIIALVALGAIAERVGDMPLAFACLLIAAAIAGFWLVNYPWGKLFMGDGGAYFSGFALAWLAVLLIARNPKVSVWAALLVCAYPVIEVVYSVVRRYIRHQSPGMADSGHLHSLIKTQLIRPKLKAVGLHQGSRNAAVSPVLWCFSSVPALFAVALFDHAVLLAFTLLAVILLYHLAHRYLAHKQLDDLAESSSSGLPPYKGGRRHMSRQHHRARDRRQIASR